jgi:hypothetical protein
MSNDASIINQNPVSLLVTLNTDRLHLFLRKRFIDVIADRLGLPVGSTGRNDKEIGETGKLSLVEDDDIFRLEVVGGLGNGFSEVSGCHFPTNSHSLT